MPPGMENLWQIVGQYGFNAVLIVLLLFYGRAALRDLSAAVDRVSRAVTLVVLAMSFLPKIFHEQAAALKEEVQDAESKRGN